MNSTKPKLLRLVGTGLLSDNIKFQIKSYLEDLTFPDKMLIEEVNETINPETERQSTLKKMYCSQSQRIQVKPDRLCH